jgi:S1-C subfamily serine protease
MLIGSIAHTRIALSTLGRNSRNTSSSRSLALLHSPFKTFRPPCATAPTLQSTVICSTTHALRSNRANFSSSAAIMDHNHAAKRKASPTSTSNRPMKQVRQDQLSPAIPANVVSADASANDTPNGYASSDSEEVEEATGGIASNESAEWQATIEKVVKNVVSIHFCQTASFDTDSAISSEATGFVVDAERGYILTNRHVVGAGPFTGHIIFDNHEECDVYPVYRDPVHDFGILRFDPKAVKYMTLHQLELRPDLAKVGSEIRIVGNDAGEKLSILSGVISRLDRNAPEYGEGYSDFNTNYLQCAAAASGGSSGSPVVNIDGFAVALQAGGRSDGASTDYFLPLDRPRRALECIRAGKPVERGTIQTQWTIQAYDQCKRLGLSPEWEAKVRAEFPKEVSDK